MDRHLSRRADGGRHADEQLRHERARHGQRAQQSTPPIPGRTTCTDTSFAGVTTSTSPGPTFWWDIFALAGDRDAAVATARRSTATSTGLLTGCTSRPSGRMWIQTDVSASTINSGAYAGFGNNQMLCADPTTRRTRRFLVGPNECEITGCFATPDETTLFVGIQHPGEAEQWTHRCPVTRRRQLVARRRCRRTATLGLARDHQGRRRRDRKLIQEAVRRFCSSK